jgi:hypothetical protein
VQLDVREERGECVVQRVGGEQALPGASRAAATALIHPA